MRVSTDLMFFLNGVIAFVVVMLALRFLKSRRDETQFRDDLWSADTRRGPVAPAQIERTLDYLALDPPPAATDKAAEKTDKVPRPDPAPYRPPNFRGKPHEVLGIAPEADRETILAAYKYWIKRYHPDRVQHLGPGYVKQANARSEQLNEAKTILLKRFE